jgi:hypothetical protein
MSQLGPGAHDWKPGIFDADALAGIEAMGINVAAIVSAAISRMRFIAKPYFRLALTPHLPEQHQEVCSRSRSEVGRSTNRPLREIHIRKEWFSSAQDVKFNRLA